MERRSYRERDGTAGKKRGLIEGKLTLRIFEKAILNHLFYN